MSINTVTKPKRTPLVKFPASHVIYAELLEYKMQYTLQLPNGTAHGTHDVKDIWAATKEGLYEWFPVQSQCKIGDVIEDGKVVGQGVTELTPNITLYLDGKEYALGRTNPRKKLKPAEPESK